MSHPLRDAFLRGARAEEHFADLQARIRTFVQAQRDAFVIHLDDKAPHDFSKMTLEYPDVFPQPPPIFSILVGEIIYNLRAALDYLACALAFKDSGKSMRAQFPIVNSPQDFESWKKHRGKGINCAHGTALEKLQPYNRCDWARILRDISDDDKHNRLVFVTRHILGQTMFTDEPIDPTKIIGPVQSAYDPETDTTMYVQHGVTVFVAFHDGSVVVSTLKEIKRSVAQTLQAFKSEF